ncbi:hypothetical protein [Spirosoma gilvum]
MKHRVYCNAGFHPRYPVDNRGFPPALQYTLYTLRLLFKPIFQNLSNIAMYFRISNESTMG